MLKDGVKKNKEKVWTRKGMKLNDFYADESDCSATAKSKYDLAMMKANADRKYSYKRNLCHEEKIQLIHNYKLLEIFLLTINKNIHKKYLIPKEKNSIETIYNHNTLTYLLYA